MIDLILLNVPAVSLSYPLAGTAILKAAVEKNGYTSKIIDLNYNLMHDINQDYSVALESYFTLGHSLDEAFNLSYQQFLEESVNSILLLNPRFIGISVFTFECQKFTVDICNKLHDKNYSGKIVIGGAGLSTTGIATKVNDFGNKMVNIGLVDYYIRGEADIAIVELLSGNTTFAGINNDNFKQIDDLNVNYVPDYVDILGNQYAWPYGKPVIPITGSRGCVRECTFCDIHKFWHKFRFRTGDNIAAEMIKQYQKYGIRDFYFTDSLINGSMRAFRNLCESLINYYAENNLPNKYFSWGGQFIIRSSLQMSAEDYKLASKAGLNGVAIGIESGSDSVREHMKKKFSNVDIDFAIENLSKNNINCYFLIIVGYPTETEQDFQDTINMFERYQPYSVDGTIFGVNLGGTLSIDEGTEIYEKQVELGMSELDNNLFGLNWVSKYNETLTIEERIRRRIVLQEKLMDMNYQVWNGDHQLKRLIKSYERIANRTY